MSARPLRRHILSQISDAVSGAAGKTMDNAFGPVFTDISSSQPILSVEKVPVFSSQPMPKKVQFSDDTDFNYRGKAKTNTRSSAPYASESFQNQAKMKMKKADMTILKLRKHIGSKKKIWPLSQLSSGTDLKIAHEFKVISETVRKFYSKPKDISFREWRRAQKSALDIYYVAGEIALNADDASRINLRKAQNSKLKLIRDQYLKLYADQKKISEKYLKIADTADSWYNSLMHKTSVS